MLDPQYDLRLWLQGELKKKGRGANGALAKWLNVRADAITRMINTDPEKETREIKAHELEMMRLFFDGAGAGEAHDEDGTVNVPVLSHISAGTFRAQDGVREADIERHIKVSHLPKGDWFALEVDGDSMDRLAPPGAVVIVNRAEHDPIDGKHYIFSLDDGAATFKQYRKEPEPMLVPQSFNPNHYAVPVGERELYVFGRVRRVITDL